MTEGLWQVFSKYERLLWGVAWQWNRNSFGRLDVEDLFYDLIFVYVECYDFYMGKEVSEEDFAKLLWKACWRRISNTEARKPCFISIDDIVVSDRGAFREVFQKFLRQDILELCKTEFGKEIFKVLVEQVEVLEDIRASKNKDKKYRVCRCDVEQFFTENRGWQWKEVRLGMSDLENALKQACMV